MAEPIADGKRAARRLGLREFRANIGTVLREAQQGRSFLVTSHGEILAEIHPPSAPRRSHREPGSLRGRIRMTADFDALPPEVLDAIEDGPT